MICTRLLHGLRSLQLHYVNIHVWWLYHWLLNSYTNRRQCNWPDYLFEIVLVLGFLYAKNKWLSCIYNLSTSLRSYVTPPLTNDIKNFIQLSYFLASLFPNVVECICALLNWIFLCIVYNWMQWWSFAVSCLFPFPFI